MKLSCRTSWRRCTAFPIRSVKCRSELAPKNSTHTSGWRAQQHEIYDASGTDVCRSRGVRLAGWLADILAEVSSVYGHRLALTCLVQCQHITHTHTHAHARANVWWWCQSRNSFREIPSLEHKPEFRTFSILLAILPVFSMV